MGLFSSKKTTYVSSVIYNLAGDEDNRPNYLKTTTIGAILGGDPNKGLGETIVNAHLNGPGMKQRRFFRWAKDNYDIGMPVASISSSYPIPSSVIQDEFPAPTGLTTVVQKAFIEAANYFYFAEKHIYANYPDLINTEWTADYSETNSEITIQYEDTTTEVIPATGYNKNKDYAIAYYYFSKPEEQSAVVEGVESDWFYDGVGVPPVPAGYVLSESVSTSSGIMDLNETTDELITYSDGRPDETTSSVTTSQVTFDNTREIYSGSTYEGTQNSDRPRSIVESYRIRNVAWAKPTEVVTSVDETLGDGTIKTTMTTVTTEELGYRDKVREDYYYVYPDQRVGEYKIMVYKLGGSRTAINDLQVDASDPLQEFFPMIPLRIKNRSIRDAANGTGGSFWENLINPMEEYDEEFYEKVNAAYRKATGDTMTEILNDLDDNESIDDIDYAYMIYGVSLNAKDDAGKEYMYRFFKNLIPFQSTSTQDYEQFIIDKDNHADRLADYEDWLAQQADENSTRYGEPSPSKINLTEPVVSTIQIQSKDSRTESYDVRINWVTINEELFTGKGKSGAKQGDYWISHGPSDEWRDEIGSTSGLDGMLKKFEDNAIHVMYMYYQDSDTTYRRLTIRGLIHQNYVYGGKFVTIDSKEAMADSDESGLVIPLHYPTLREMSIISSTQLTTTNVLIVFNCYQVVKQKWWQKGIFKIILVIAVAVITVYFAPAGAVTGGILGANTIVGGALGLSGTTALLVGAAVNAIAAMVLTSIISSISTKLFGAKWGGVIAAFVSFAAMNGLTNMATNGQLGMNWGSMMRMENIMQLANVGANAYGAWARGEILETYDAMAEAKEEYEKQSEEIDKLTSEFLNSGIVLDPMLFTKATDRYDYESPTDFINRTTMVGSDMIDLSFSMIYDYTEMNLTLPKGGE
jgi:hypothetical protein